MASDLASIAPKHEYLITCPILKESGGGTIYRCIGSAYPHAAGRVYKHVKDQNALNALPRIFESIRGAALPDIVHPTSLVYDMDGLLTGYLMHDVREASTLSDLAALVSVSKLPLVDFIGRVSVAMKASALLHLHPMVEHGGNVMVSLSGPHVEVSIIDVDGWFPDVPNLTDGQLMEQLPMIFLNFERHPYYNTFFVHEGTITKVKASFRTIADIVLACCHASTNFCKWFAGPTFSHAHS